MSDKKKDKAQDKKAPKITRKRSAHNAVKQAASLGKVRVEQKTAKPKKPSLVYFTLAVIYRNLYFLGITLLRYRLRYIRKTKLFFLKIKGTAFALLYKLSMQIKKLYFYTNRRIKAPFLRIKIVAKQQKPHIEEKKKQGKFPFAEYFAITEAVFRFVFKIVSTVFNYTAPFVAGAYLVFVVQTQTSQEMWLELEYNGEVMGFINNEIEFEEATAVVNSRLISDYSSEFYVPHFTLKQPSQGDLLIDTAQLADKIISVSGGNIGKAYGLYIDNNLLGAVTESDKVLTTLDEIKSLTASGKPNERVQFTKSIKLKEGLYPTGSIVSTDTLVESLQKYETVDRKYIAKQGDTPSGISDEQRIPYSVLTALNPTIEEELYVGMEIMLEVAQPFLSVKSIYTDTYTEEFDFKTIETKNAIYAKGYEKVTKEGEKGIREIVAEITIVNGLETNREILDDTKIIKPAVDKLVTVGSANPQAIATPQPGTNMAGSSATSVSGFIWPTSGGYISNPLNGYPGHTGIDIVRAGGVGAPIYAAAAGTVTKVMRTWVGYGQWIKIDHGNGFETLYAHNSALYVKVGQQVAQGDVIAGMGSTGNSTAVHLHFEVIENGRIRNPVNYVGTG